MGNPKVAPPPKTGKGFLKRHHPEVSYDESSLANAARAFLARLSARSSTK
jgi:hypothetical protein